MSTLTPMMRQYKEIKASYPDCILFFRLGDFYELFEDDARKGAEILGIVLTHRNGTPMCGVPHHALDQYLTKLTRSGQKVALCEQVSDPTLPGIVKREVVRVVTPGTTFNENLLDTKSNNYLLSLYPQRDRFGLATIDLTTGTFFVTELHGYDQLTNELQRLQPKECIFPREVNDPHLKALFDALGSIHTYAYSSPEEAALTLQKQFHVQSVEALGVAQWPLAIEAAGVLINYLKETQKTPLLHLKPLKSYTQDEAMILDEATLRNLELITTLREGQKQGSLIGVLDHTQTAMGGRLLKSWLLRPLTQREKIEERLLAVDALVQHGGLHQNLRDILSNILDLERVLSRLILDRGTPRDLVALKVSLQFIPALKNQLAQAPEGLLSTLHDALRPLKELVDHIQQAIVDEPPMAVKEGGFIQDGFHADLDELRTLSREGKGFIKHLQQQEIERTGINSLKVKYNRVFGYYIEISNSNLGNVPENYIRKQTLVNAERYITPELKAYEEKVLTAEDKSKALEHELFKKVRERVIEELSDIQQNAEAVATLDVLLTFAHVAQTQRYVRPQLRDDGVIEIVGGRHPVVESMNAANDFVPNDTTLNLHDQQIILLTGPNMSGKSTLLRQVALMSLLAQVGSYVPAESAQLSIVDRIFTRVGASDNLVRGQSTFMVEMQEAANILRNATNRSLVILDEIGRGTSTYDGVSIAWAILEHLHDEIGAKTLFASHYHELIAVADRLPRAKNFSVAVHEDERGVVFLHKIRPGGVDKSYGIEVAKLAGVPHSVIVRSQQILKDLEEGVVEEGIRQQMKETQPRDQTSLFAPKETESNRLHKRLQEIDINQMTPLQALQALEELKRAEEKE